MALCWQEVDFMFLCRRPLLERQTTYTECCCQYGEAWGIECALCPLRDTDEHAALCYMRGDVEDDDLYPYPLGYEPYGAAPRPELSPDPRDYGGFGPVEPPPFLVAEPRRSRSDHGSSRPRPWSPPAGPSSRTVRYSLAGQRLPETRLQPRRSSGRHDRRSRFPSVRADECGVLSGCENGRCIRIPAGFTCDCDPGYTLHIARMTCVDIDECDEAEDGSMRCINGRCVNTGGSYRCTCPQGYVLSQPAHHCTPAQSRVTAAGL
ncbi:latent-transforming growth factor beta-binding protein 4-like isoform X1 [Amblyraja radiata]|uniref:latent-transforming growth factor beta-binding protein 4-like isoform X1 n=1 Tax=Amblyraja radiata TaxID=386614 RepID=UPI001403BF1C|nr:latent-transforming growth factor beta-binding protein 4-like isoform X1 [Amblyraja radiata]